MNKNHQILYKLFMPAEMEEILKFQAKDNEFLDSLSLKLTRLKMIVKTGNLAAWEKFQQEELKSFQFFHV